MPVHLVYVKQGLLPLKVRAFPDWMTPRLRQRLKALPRRGFSFTRSSRRG